MSKFEDRRAASEADKRIREAGVRGTDRRYLFVRGTEALEKRRAIINCREEAHGEGKKDSDA